MNQCSECKRSIPQELLAPLVTTDGSVGDVCGICALAISNAHLGLERTEFQGETAEAMRQEAIKYYEESGQSR